MLDGGSDEEADEEELAGRSAHSARVPYSPESTYGTSTSPYPLVMSLMTLLVLHQIQNKNSVKCLPNAPQNP